MITRETITAVAKKIAHSFNPEKIILFGSYAWGKPEIDSDLDLFIVMESKDRPIKRAVSVKRVLKDLYVPMDIVVRTPDEPSTQDRYWRSFYPENIERWAGDLCAKSCKSGLTRVTATLLRQKYWLRTKASKRLLLR